MNSVSLIKNNKGLSLVELIVAISIGTIISGSIVALIAFSVRMYSNQKKETEIQHEVQATVNQVVDSIEDGKWFVLANSVDGTTIKKTNYFAIGRVETFPSGTNKYFVGELFATGTDDGTVTGRFKVYMNRYSIPASEADADDDLKGIMSVTDVANAKTKLAGSASSISTGANKDRFLLADDATGFVIALDKNKGKDIAGNDYFSNGKYINPLSFDVDITFERTGYGRVISRNITDYAYMRNRAVDDVYEILKSTSGTTTTNTFVLED